MSIKQFELMHGAVILKICRNRRPLSLTLIESDGARAAYNVNMDVNIYIKHSISPQSRQRRDQTVWQFSFSPAHIAELSNLGQKGELYLALVCANDNLEDMEVAFLEPDDIQEGLDLTALTQQTLRVHIEPGKKLRVYGRGGTDSPILIERKRLDDWDVPNR